MSKSVMINTTFMDLRDMSLLPFQFYVDNQQPLMLVCQKCQIQKLHENIANIGTLS